MSSMSLPGKFTRSVPPCLNVVVAESLPSGLAATRRLAPTANVQAASHSRPGTTFPPVVPLIAMTGSRPGLLAKGPQARCLRVAPNPTQGGRMNERETTLGDEEIRTEASGEETRSEVADVDGDDEETADTDDTDADADADDTDADADDTDPS